MKRLLTVIFFLSVFIAIQCKAEDEMPDMSMPSHPHEETTNSHPPYFQDPKDCSEDEFFDRMSAMCYPLSMANMKMSMLMLHGNAFGVGIFESGPHAKNEFAAPNMMMADAGTSLNDHHYLNLDLMATAENWTYPKSGYSELLQIGEVNSLGQPYIDSQHPHSSPIMGLTLSDTIRLNDTNNHLIRLFFAPRGESTDGPIPFMHRPTGMVNPDAPLGHHIGQDVGHISSTVIGASFISGKTRIDVSTFNGTEPQPTVVNLPIQTPNSYALRVGYDFNPNMTAMVSAAYLQNPEPQSPDLRSVSRYSASLYNHTALGQDWNYYNSLIFGLINNYDHVPQLASIGEEFLFAGHHPRIWGRIEVLQRTPSELAINTISNPMNPRWVGALTIGYTHALTNWNELEAALGASTTVNFLPPEFSAAYGSQNPWTWKIFLQIGGMKMWSY